MIAIDASALSKYILKEPGWVKMGGYLRSGVSVDHVEKEVANSIWKAYVLGYIGLEDAMIKFKALRRIVSKVIVIFDENRVMDSAFNIALENKVTVYDALYIALAGERGLPLLTADRKQADAAEKLGIKTIKC